MAKEEALGPKRNPNYGGLSLRLIFSRSPDVIEQIEDLMHKDALLHEQWRRDGVAPAEAEAALDSLLLDHAWRNAPDRHWLAVAGGRYSDAASYEQAKTFCQRSAGACSAALIEMERKWAPPEPTRAAKTGVPPLDVDYKTAFYNAQKLLGNGRETELMSYLGSLWRTSPGLAAAALVYAQKLTAEFYRSHPNTD